MLMLEDSKKVCSLIALRGGAAAADWSGVIIAVHVSLDLLHQMSDIPWRRNKLG